MADRPAAAIAFIRRASVLGGCAALLASCASSSRADPGYTVSYQALVPPTDAPPATPGGDLREAAFVDSVLALMTLPEKLGQVNQYAGSWGPNGVIVDSTVERQVRSGQVGSFLSVWGVDATRRLQRIAVEQSRLKIPLLFAQDVIHGFRTVFPVPLAEAASWDPRMAREAARIAAWEASAYGIHWTFAPMVDIARDPRWGRIVEGSGEDPYLGSVMAAARVRGFQGTDLRAPTSIA
ncbi:glycoside hydrolase family 3 N-terminal domain-containing protein, partial [Longimicrobium sp.]|uniref:glycoside hydrolase family 3 N-terminal domain-containing protein n=1 Tax=Longimicrobium sp. TaxID=2029185 RepID=UPI002E33C6CB